MPNHFLSGVFAAAVTPLKPDLTPDLKPLPAFLGFLAERGCHGALLFGTTGEGPSFSPAERSAVLQAALQAKQQHPDFHLLAGTGTPSLQETIDLTKTAFNLGYEGVVVLPPYYFRNVSDDGLFAWFSAVIHRAVPGDGHLLGYHIPGLAGVGFSMELLKRLKGEFPQQFAGIKDSSHDTRFATALGSIFGSDMTVFSGTDSDFSLALQNHAAGCITAPANLVSPELRKIYNAFQEGGDTSTFQGKLTNQRQSLEKFLPFPPTLKALLARLYNLPRWPVRPPLVELNARMEEMVVNEFRSL